MTAIKWDQAGDRLYETGVDRAVLYPRSDAGAYDKGYPWNGIVAITESPTGAEATPQYADNIKYINLVSVEEFEGTIEAFTYPDQFEECDGTASPVPGLTIGQQNRRTFGLSYRTLVGNDIVGTDYGYKLHLVYGALAAPSEKARNTINESPEAATFSWAFTTTPVDVPGFRPSATLTIDSSKVEASVMAALEELLYGGESSEAGLPLPEVVFNLLDTREEATPLAPTFDDLTNKITIPTVTGVVYKIDGVTVSGTVDITEDETVVAEAAEGYKLPSGGTTSWTFTYSE